MVADDAARKIDGELKDQGNQLHRGDSASETAIDTTAGKPLHSDVPRLRSIECNHLLERCEMPHVQSGTSIYITLIVARQRDLSTCLFIYSLSNFDYF